MTRFIFVGLLRTALLGLKFIGALTRMMAVMAMVAVAALVLAACSTSAAEVSETPTATAEPVPTAIPTATPEPTATAVPTVTPEPTPTPDPLLAQAEAIALEYSELTAELFNDPRNMDLSRMVALEAGPEPRQPMTDWALRAVANLLEENRYRPSDPVRYQVVSSQWDPEYVGELAWVDICTQTGGEWFDIETDELVMDGSTSPFIKRVRVVTDSMQVAAVAERFDGEQMPCEFGDGPDQ